jgi:hypothetical protein
VNRAGDQFLARTRLALDEHRAVHRGDQLEGGEEPLHRAVAANDVVEPPALGLDDLNLFDLRDPLFGERRLEDARELGQFKWLRQEINGPALHGGHRVGDFAEPGNDDRPDLGVPDDGVAEHFHPVGVREVQVDHHRVICKVLQPVDGVGRVDGLGRGKPTGFKRFGQRLPQIDIVFNYQNGGKCH